LGIGLTNFIAREILARYAQDNNGESQQSFIKSAPFFL